MSTTYPTILHDASALSWRRPVEITEKPVIYQQMTRERLGKGQFVFPTAGSSAWRYSPTATEQRELAENLLQAYQIRYGAEISKASNALGRLGEIASATASTLRSFAERFVPVASTSIARPWL